MGRKHTFRLVLNLCLILALASACGGLPTAPLIPDQDAFAESVTEEPAGLEDNQAEADVLRAGDLLDLEVVGERTWRGEALRLGQGGAVSIPLAGPVLVAGLSLNEASTTLTEAARRFEKQAVVTAWLREPAGRNFTVNGAVRTPGVYPLFTQVRVSEALARAGGGISSVSDGEIIEQGDIAGAKLIRNGEVLPVSIALALQGQAKHDAYIHAGDVLFVPSSKARRITVLGEVDKPVVILYREGMRLTEALGRAGGLNDDADGGDVRVIRGSLAKPKIYQASLADLVSGKGRDVVLAPGDVVFVTEHWFASATDVVRRLTPALAGAAAALVLGK